MDLLRHYYNKSSKSVVLFVEKELRTQRLDEYTLLEDPFEDVFTLKMQIVTYQKK